MPAITTLTVNGLSGADHVFAPFSIDSKGVATLIAPGTSPVGDEKMTLSVNRAPNGGKIKTELRFVIPKVQDVVVGGVTKPTVVRTGNIVVTMSTDATATADDRNELFALLCSALTLGENPEIVHAFQNSTPFY